MKSGIPMRIDLTPENNARLEEIKKKTGYTKTTIVRLALFNFLHQKIAEETKNESTAKLV